MHRTAESARIALGRAKLFGNTAHAKISKSYLSRYKTDRHVGTGKQIQDCTAYRRTSISRNCISRRLSYRARPRILCQPRVSRIRNFNRRLPSFFQIKLASSVDTRGGVLSDSPTGRRSSVLGISIPTIPTIPKILVVP